MMRRAVIALLLLSACGSPTEVTVEIEADTRVRSEATQLDIQVFGAGPDTEFASVLERTLDAPTFPVRVTLAPRDGALDRRFRIEVVARDAMGATLASAQAEGRYQQGISERLQLELSEACTDIACDPGTVCVAGRCVAGDAGPRDAGPRDAGPTDGGPTDSGPTDSGPFDGGPFDGGPSDGGPSDGGPSDGGPSDGGPSDGAPPSTCGDGVCQVEDLDVFVAE
ncbi:MAG: hypothetical protein AB8I08_22720, partial [Sandaracinaceae bacterium]